MDAVTLRTFDWYVNRYRYKTRVITLFILSLPKNLVPIITYQKLLPSEELDPKAICAKDPIAKKSGV